MWPANLIFSFRALLLQLPSHEFAMISLIFLRLAIQCWIHPSVVLRLYYPRENILLDFVQGLQCLFPDVKGGGGETSRAGYEAVYQTNFRRDLEVGVSEGGPQCL